jgi:HSP20 family molecular chaperone IbpA
MVVAIVIFLLLNNFKLQMKEKLLFVEIITTDKEVKVVIKVPGISKEDIKVNAYDTLVENICYQHFREKKSSFS